jgi:hypothetical protein
MPRAYLFLAFLIPQLVQAGPCNVSRHLRQEETEPTLRSAYAYAEAITRQAPECDAAYAELALTLFSLFKLGSIPRDDIEMELRKSVV